MPSGRRASAWHDRPVRFFVVVFLASLLIAGAEELASRIRTSLFEPVSDERWIWAEGAYDEGDALAFYAARDFEIEAVGTARLALTADETYLVYVNGYRVGAGSYRGWSPVDEYDISPLLREGLNRIVVELRSSRGAGGFLAVLELMPEDQSTRSCIVSDESWRIFRRYEPGLLGGWTQLSGGEIPKLWHRPPAGRWRLGSTAKRQPNLFQSAIEPLRRLPLRLQQQHSSEWHELQWPVLRRVPGVGPHQLYDWGRVVEGLLSFDLISAEGQPGLLYVGLEPPDPEQQRPDTVILPVPGRRHWEDAYLRRFRYALIVGAEPYSRVEVDVLPPRLTDKLPRPHRDQAGVFGLEPPRSYAKVEEDVWKRIGSSSSVSESEDLPR